MRKGTPALPGIRFCAQGARRRRARAFCEPSSPHALVPSSPPACEARKEAGATFLWVAVAIFLLAVLLMLAVQPASIVAQRLKEKELLFRGLEFTEGIRAYQSEHAGAFPPELEELLKPGPKQRRYIRKLWKNPFDPEGQWGLLAPGSTVVSTDEEGKLHYTYSSGPAAGAAQGILKPGQSPQRPGQTAGPGGTPTPQQGGEGGGEGGQPGQPSNTYVLPFRLDGNEDQPVVGVYCKLHKEAFSEFLGKTYYDEWYFSPLVIPPPKPVGQIGTTQVPAAGTGTQPPKPGGGGEK